MPARPRSKFSSVTIILLDTSKEIYCILNLFQPILFEILETLTAPGIKSVQGGVQGHQSCTVYTNHKIMFASLQSSIFQDDFRKSKIKEACKRKEDRQAQ